MSVVAVHGALGQPADWRGVIACGVEEMDAVDLFSSEFVSAAPESGLMSAGRQIADRWGNSGRNVLAGYSMGGRLALHALTCRNARWQGAVIIAAHPGLVTADARRRRLAADAVWADKLERMHPDAFFLEWNRQRVFASDMPDSVRSGFTHPSRRRLELLSLCFRNWSLGAQKSLWPRLKEIETPITWMVGQRDSKFVRIAERAVSRLPQGRLVIVPGCGHRLLEEAPETVAREIAELA